MPTKDGAGHNLTKLVQNGASHVKFQGMCTIDGCAAKPIIETVADESDRPALEARLAQQDFEDINGPVLERHGGPEPIGCRSS
jgi:hypothetical protein